MRISATKNIYKLSNLNSSRINESKHKDLADLYESGNSRETLMDFLKYRYKILKDEIENNPKIQNKEEQQKKLLYTINTIKNLYANLDQQWTREKVQDFYISSFVDSLLYLPLSKIVEELKNQNLQTEAKSSVYFEVRKCLEQRKTQIQQLKIAINNATVKEHLTLNQLQDMCKMLDKLRSNALSIIENVSNWKQRIVLIKNTDLKVQQKALLIYMYRNKKVLEIIRKDCQFLAKSFLARFIIFGSEPDALFLYPYRKLISFQKSVMDQFECIIKLFDLNFQFGYRLNQAEKVLKEQCEALPVIRPTSNRKVGELERDIFQKYPTGHPNAIKQTNKRIKRFTTQPVQSEYSINRYQSEQRKIKYELPSIETKEKISNRNPSMDANRNPSIDSNPTIEIASTKVDRKPVNKLEKIQPSFIGYRKMANFQQIPLQNKLNGYSQNSDRNSKQLNFSSEFNDKPQSQSQNNKMPSIPIRQQQTANIKKDYEQQRVVKVENYDNKSKPQIQPVTSQLSDLKKQNISLNKNNKIVKDKADIPQQGQSIRQSALITSENAKSPPKESEVNNSTKSYLKLEDNVNNSNNAIATKIELKLTQKKLKQKQYLKFIKSLMNQQFSHFFIGSQDNLLTLAMRQVYIIEISLHKEAYAVAVFHKDPTQDTIIIKAFTCKTGKYFQQSIKMISSYIFSKDPCKQIHIQTFYKKKLDDEDQLKLYRKMLNNAGFYMKTQQLSKQKSIVLYAIQRTNLFPEEQLFSHYSPGLQVVMSHIALLKTLNKINFSSDQIDGFNDKNFNSNYLIIQCLKALLKQKQLPELIKGVKGLNQWFEQLVSHKAMAKCSTFKNMNNLAECNTKLEQQGYDTYDTTKPIENVGLATLRLEYLFEFNFFVQNSYIYFQMNEKYGQLHQFQQCRLLIIKMPLTGFYFVLANDKSKNVEAKSAEMIISNHLTSIISKSNIVKQPKIGVHLFNKLIYGKVTELNQTYSVFGNVDISLLWRDYFEGRLVREINNQDYKLFDQKSSMGVFVFENGNYTPVFQILIEQPDLLFL